MTTHLDDEEQATVLLAQSCLDKYPCPPETAEVFSKALDFLKPSRLLRAVFDHAPSDRGRYNIATHIVGKHGDTVSMLFNERLEFLSRQIYFVLIQQSLIPHLATDHSESSGWHDSNLADQPNYATYESRDNCAGILAPFTADQSSSPCNLRWGQINPRL